MPITSVPGPSRLQFRLIVGEDEEGKTLLRTRSFGRVKPDIEDQDIFDVGEQIMALQVHQVFSVNRMDTKELIGEE